MLGTAELRVIPGPQRNDCEVKLTHLLSSDSALDEESISFV